MSVEVHVLASWKEIARHTGKSVRTVQRWEAVFGMPVRRPDGANVKKSSVLIYRKELDVWLAERFIRPKRNSAELRAALKETIRLSRELRAANRKLSAELSRSIRLCSKECRRLAMRSLERPWSATSPNTVRMR